MDIKITKGQSIIVNEKPYGCSVMETKRGFTWVPNSTFRDQGLTCLTSNSMSGLLTIASFYGKMRSQLEDLPDQLTLKSSVIYSLIKHSGSLAYLPVTPKPSSRELIDLPLNSAAGDPGFVSEIASITYILSQDSSFTKCSYKYQFEFFCNQDGMSGICTISST